MAINRLDGLQFKKIVTCGAKMLRANYKIVDSLNVFPVPDGDTGTNMRMTIEIGCNEISNIEEQSIYEMAKKLSRGMLMGARGNSGVILSQLFHGIYKGLLNKETVNAVELGKAFKSGVVQAYSSVMKPVEGTILTVAKDASEYASKKVNKNSSIEDYLTYFLKEARESLERTPELLAVLKEAGVVDSGATGLVYIIEGMLKGIKGEMIAESEEEAFNTNVSHSFDAHSELTYGYCTEFILQLQHKKVNIATFDTKEMTEYLNSIGDSLVLVKDEDLIKVHVHTKTPGEVLNFGQKYGEYITIKVENMSVQHSAQTVDTQAQCDCPECVEMRRNNVKKKYAVVAVASGEGLVETFKEMGVDYVVYGGQTMNPSTDDFIQGYETINADHIIVFPNNSNIILAANQSAEIYDKAKVHVIPTKSIAQGYSALTMLDLSSDNIDTITEESLEVISNVTTGLVTYSIRDAEFEGVSIKKGDFIAIVDGQIIASCSTKEEAALSILNLDLVKEKEIVTIIYGEDVSSDDLAVLTSYIDENIDSLEYDSVNGKQSIYSYILSIE